jgi:hypothetical protein
VRRFWKVSVFERLSTVEIIVIPGCLLFFFSILSLQKVESFIRLLTLHPDNVIDSSSIPTLIKTARHVYVQRITSLCVKNPSLNIDCQYEALPLWFFFFSRKSNHSNQSASFYLESLHILCYSLFSLFSIYSFFSLPQESRLLSPASKTSCRNKQRSRWQCPPQHFLSAVQLPNLSICRHRTKRLSVMS